MANDIGKDTVISAINASIRLNVLELFKQLKETYDKKFEIYDEDLDNLNKFMIRTSTWMDGHDKQHKRDLTILTLVITGATLLINLAFHLMK